MKILKALQLDLHNRIEARRELVLAWVLEANIVAGSTLALIAELKLATYDLGDAMIRWTPSDRP